MNKLFTVITLVFLSTSQAEDLYYQVEKNDQIGSILLSLGHINLWSRDQKVNQFKKQQNIDSSDKIWEGAFLKFSDDNIIFKNNIIRFKDSFKFKKKINTLSQYYEMQNQEVVNDEQITRKNFSKIEVFDQKKSDVHQKTVIPKKEVVNEETVHSLNLYPGIGGFIASDQEEDRGVSTSTFTGLQPLIQFKGIYSTDLFGSLSIDLLSKKIISSKFSFPINLDYRVQFVPKWNLSDGFKLAFSHSTIRHSYVGKSSNIETSYELKSNFVGIGMVVPRDNFWLEMYLEKAYSGKTTSKEQTINANQGLRIDAELVYPIYRQWTIIPGLNYYRLKDPVSNYKLSVFETRLVLAMEFEL